MKLMLVLFVFFLTLGLTIKSVANNEAKQEPAVCTAENKSHCTDTTANHSGTHEKTHSAEAAENSANHHNKKSTEMNSLFPQKEQNAAQTHAPKTVKLTSPAFLAQVNGDTAQLQWTAGENATAYHIQVATDPNFKWLVANEYWVKETSYSVKALTPGQKYFWRVAAVKGENDSMFTKSLFVDSVFSTTSK